MGPTNIIGNCKSKTEARALFFTLKTDGPLPSRRHIKARAYFIKQSEILNKKIDMLYQLEAYPDKPMPLLERDAKAYDKINAGRMTEKRPQVPCLWKSDERPSVDNRDYAETRLSSLRRSFRTAEEKQQYLEVFLDWLARDIIERVPEAEIARHAHYLPHFAVIKRDKNGRPIKIRPVMDAKTKHRGECLNDFMTPGPNLLTDMIQVLLRFRRCSVAIGGGPHRHVPLHRDAQRR